MKFRSVVDFSPDKPPEDDFAARFCDANDLRCVAGSSWKCPTNRVQHHCAGYACNTSRNRVSRALMVAGNENPAIGKRRRQKPNRHIRRRWFSRRFVEVKRNAGCPKPQLVTFSVLLVVCDVLPLAGVEPNAPGWNCCNPSSRAVNAD
jgi:hypothetical protein